MENETHSTVEMAVLCMAPKKLILS